MTKSPFSLKLPSELLIKVREQAKKEHRPVNNFIELVLLDHFKKLESEEQKKPGE